ncbi:E3 ubiquitin-protein ligase TRIM71-like [Dysidea avara]|uniref:E3 ubiquitin-protein ligase TRIM71-like n=1 Tax=Dysidea avara TaxID=196820 RepID=UPI0033276C81
MASNTLSRNSSVEQSGEELQEIEEEITCAICGNLFSDPKTIPCLHTFCKSCLERSIESNKKMAVDVCCPLCRASLPRDEVASIPTNFTIKRLVEIVRKRKEDKVECDNCRIHRHNSTSKIKKAGDVKAEDTVSNAATSDLVAPAAYWCVQCSKCLCEKCHDAHKQWAEFVEHKCIAIEEIMTNSTQDSKSTATQELEGPEMMCKHHTKPLDFYCRTCRCLICHYCATKDHRNHDFEDKLTEVADEEREKVKNATVPLDEMLEQVRRALKELEDIENQIDVEGIANVEMIRATYEEVHKLLKQQEEEAIDKANANKRSCKKRLATQKENAKFLESELARCDEARTDIMAVDRTRKLLTYSDWIKSRVDRLKIQVENSNFDPDCTAIDIIAKHRKPIEFINNLGFEQFDVPCLSTCSFSRYGHIVKPTDLDQPESPNPLPTTPKARNLLNPFKEASHTDQIKVTVTLKDAFGFPVVKQSTHIEIRCNKDEDFLQNTCIKERLNGQYFIWYTPKISENHLLQIYWKGHLVNHEEIKVLMTVRDYNNVGQAAKTIEKYGSSNTQLIEPNLLAKGPNNELIVCDHSTKQLVVFDKQFQYSDVIGGAGRGNGKFQRVTGLAVDRNGYLYAADCTLHCIQKFNLSGEFISQFSSGENSSPFGLVLSQSEQLFVCDSSNDRIQVFQYEKFTYGFGQHGTEPGDFNHPQDLALNNSEDQLFITDHRNDRVQVFTPKGQFLRFFDRFTNVMFRLKSPFGIHYTPDGYLLASSQDSNCVLVFKEDGNFVRAIESMYRGKKRFSDPRGVLVMDDGQIVIADKSNNRLIVF